MKKRYIFCAIALSFLTGVCFAESDYEILKQARSKKKEAVEYQKAKELTKAREKFLEALNLYEQLGMEKAEGEILFSIGETYYDQGNKAKAEEYFLGGIFVAGGGKKDSKSFQSNETTREFEKKIAEKDATLGIQISVKILKKDILSTSLGMMEDLYGRSTEGIKPEDEEALQEAFFLFSAATIALTQEANFTKALKKFQESNSIYLRLGKKKELAEQLMKIASIYTTWFDYDNGLSFYNQALNLFRELNDEEKEVDTLNGIGKVYFDLEKDEEAKSYYQKAIEIAKEINYNWGLANSYSNLGKIEAIYSRWSEVAHLIKEGQKYMKRWQEAAKGKKSWKIDQQYMQVGNYFLNIAEAIFKKEDIKATESALGLFDTVVSIEEGKKVRDIRIMEAALIGKAKALIRLNRQKEAKQTLEKAISFIEAERRGIGGETARVGFFEKKVEAYETMIYLLFSEGDFASAFNLTERARSRTFLDLLGSKQIRKPKVKDLELAMREQALIKAIGEEEEKLYPQQGEMTVRTIKIKEKSQKLVKLEKEYETVINELVKVEPEYSSLVSANPITLGEFQGLLDDNTAALSYFLGKERGFIFLISKEKINAFELQVKPSQIKESVLDFRKIAVENTEDNPLTLKRLRGEDWKESLKNLHKILVLPADDLIASKKNLLIIPQGVLHYLPFSSLLDSDEKYLVQRFSISYAPSASVIKFCFEKKESANKEIFAIGNPLFEDLPPLDAAEIEVKRFASIFSSPLILTQDKATEAKFKEECKDFKILHLATHGELNKLYPLKSNLRLTKEGIEDGRLTVEEIFDLNLSANLVTLSACETGLSGAYRKLSKRAREKQDGQFPPGDELVGLTRAFIYAGTPSIIATLWTVYDESTARLMGEFYKNLKVMPKAEALRRAQLSIINSEVRTTKGEISGSHPFFWAPFTLVGDWR